MSGTWSKVKLPPEVDEIVKRFQEDIDAESKPEALEAIIIAGCWEAATEGEKEQIKDLFEATYQ
jgi:hypothetical protein